MLMQMLSDDDLNLRELSDEELAQAWDLWFDLAQTTNDADPPYTHGVFQAVGVVPSIEQSGDSGGSETMNSGSHTTTATLTIFEVDADGLEALRTISRCGPEG
jgi:hypothetical protein